MKSLIRVLSVVVIAGLAGCATLGDMFENEKKVALADVPAPVVAAAKNAVKGFAPTAAVVEKEDGQTVYELEGSADGKTYEIDVTADGKVLEVEEDKD